MKLIVSDHCIERYIERVKPTLEDQGQAGRELRALIELVGEPYDSPPGWLPRYYVKPGEKYVEISDGIVVCFESHPHKNVAVTVLTRGGCSDQERAARKKAKRKKREKAGHVQEFKDASGRRRKQRLRHQIMEGMNG
jgi:hypothetical protein